MKKAAYDSYDYPSYWNGRDYEHESEVVTLKEFLGKIKSINALLDLGAGFGRLAPYYLHRAKKITLADPSHDLLVEAEGRLSSLKNSVPKKLKNITFVVSGVEEVAKNFKKNQFDAVVIVRVMHHLKDPKETIESISHILKPGGYLILEFANKLHGKALVKNLLKGNFTYPIDIFPIERATKKSAPLPFLNHHPDIIKDILTKNGFKILERRSVSNIRSSFLKKHLPIPLLVSMERLIQKPLAKINFGPSVFILARKRNL